MSIPLSRRALMIASAAVFGGLASPVRAGQSNATTPSPIQGRLMQAAGTRLWVEDYGPRDAPALLYVHGGPGLGVFEFSHYQRDRLPGPVRLVLVDQRGVLRSDPLAAGEGVTLEQLSMDFETVRRTLGIPRWSILGHSWGGPIALDYANRYPDSVDRVVFENAVLDADATARNMLAHTHDALEKAGKNADARAVAAVMAHRRTKDLWDRMDASLNRLPSRQSLYVYDPAFLGYYGRITTGSGIADDRWTQGVQMALSLLKTPEALSPAWNRMSALAQPTLLMRGETDPATSPREIEMMSSKPNVTVTTVPRSSHFIHVEQPDVFARTVQRFLA